MDASSFGTHPLDNGRNVRLQPGLDRFTRERLAAARPTADERRSNPMGMDAPTLDLLYGDALEVA